MGEFIDQKSTAHTKAGMLTPAQLRAARALVNWSRDDLAVKSGTSVYTVKTFEVGQSDPKMGTVAKWRRALSQAGVVFIDDDGQQGPGARLRDAAGRKGR